jgi:hypothetical protein
MKHLPLFALLSILLSCSQSVQKPETAKNGTQRTEVVRPDF